MITIDFEGVGLRFGSNALFHDLTTRISSGAVTVVTGCNGSGKSTFLCLAARLILPDEGNIRILDGNAPLGKGAFRRRLAMVRPEWNLYPHLTAEENLRFFLGMRGISLDSREVEFLWERVGLSAEEIRGRYGSELSTGMGQRVKFAILLASEADVWLMDEPSANLDTAGLSMVLEESHRAAIAGKLVLLATNDPREEEAADTVIRLPWG